MIPPPTGWSSASRPAWPAEGAVGLAFAAGEGIAGYVFTTGQPLAVADVASDPRFDRAAAERTGYVPRSILAVPLLDDAGSIGVLEVLDRRGDQGFGLRDLDLASVFARQAAVAIRASRVERDVDRAPPAHPGTARGRPRGRLRRPWTLRWRRSRVGLDDEEGARLWALADAVARARRAAPDQVALVVEILDALARRGSRPAPRSFRR